MSKPKYNKPQPHQIPPGYRLMYEGECIDNTDLIAAKDNFIYSYLYNCCGWISASGLEQLSCNNRNLYFITPILPLPKDFKPYR